MSDKACLYHRVTYLIALLQPHYDSVLHPLKLFLTLAKALAEGSA